MKRMLLLVLVTFLASTPLVLLHASEVTVGTGDQLARKPIDMNYKNSLFECLFFQEELMIAEGSIYGIGFYNNFVNSQKTQSDYRTPTATGNFIDRGRTVIKGTTEYADTGSRADDSGTSETRVRSAKFNPSADSVISDGLGKTSISGFTTPPTTLSDGYSSNHIIGHSTDLSIAGKSWELSDRDIEIMRDFRNRNIATVSENAISKLDSTDQARYFSLCQQVNERQSQIEYAYRRGQFRQAMGFMVTLYIASNGKILSADVIPLGDYPPSFVSDVKRMIQSWKFNVQQEMSYRFRIRLIPRK